MVKFTNGEQYLEIGIFDAIFSTAQGRKRRAALVKRLREERKAKAKATAEKVAAENAPKAEEKPATEAAPPGGTEAENAPESAPVVPEATEPPLVSAAAEEAKPANPVSAPAPEPASAQLAPEAVGPDAPPPAGKGEWDDAKTKKLCGLKQEGKAWAEVGRALGEDPEACIDKYASLPKDQRSGHKLRSDDWDDKDVTELLALKDSNKPWAYISASVDRSEAECKKKLGEVKKAQAKQDSSKKGKALKDTDNAQGSDKGGKKPVPVTITDLPEGQFACMDGRCIGEDMMSAYDPGEPAFQEIRGAGESFAASPALADQFGREVDQVEFEYLIKLALYYDKQKWQCIASRFFDETGKRVSWQGVKYKVGRLRLP